MSPLKAPRGRFVTLEGGEGAGKSTQARLLAARLEQRGIPALLTREPGGSPRAEEIRSLILSGAVADLGPAVEAVLFYAARADHLAATIRPALARGTWVICDRFSDSTRAYQGVAGGVRPAILESLERIVVGDDAPDVTLVLDLPAEQGLARAAARRGDQAGDRFESEALAFHQALRDAFLAIARREPGRCAVVDAEQSEETVSDAIWRVVAARLLGETEPVDLENAS